jgi:hypothetical protein
MVCCHISKTLPTVAYGNGDLVSMNIPPPPMPCDLHRFRFIITFALYRACSHIVNCQESLACMRALELYYSKICDTKETMG